MKKLLLLLLTIALISTNIIKADENQITTDFHYETYTVLGDSIAAGHSLPDYEAYAKKIEIPEEKQKYASMLTAGAGDGHLIKDSYAQLLSEYVGATKVNCEAMVGFNFSALRYLIDEDYQLDDITADYIGTMTSKKYDAETILELSPDYIEAIKEADLITINAGINDYLYRGLDMVFKMFGKTSKEASSTETSETGFIASIKKLFNTVKTIINLIKDVKTLIKESEESIKGNFDASIIKIREINPKAKIIVVGLYNPIKNAVISDSININVGKFLNKTIKKTNKYFKEGSQYSNEYTYVDVMDVDVNGQFTLSTISELGLDFFESLITNTHPSIEGHKYIAEQIKAALNS